VANPNRPKTPTLSGSSLSESVPTKPGDPPVSVIRFFLGAVCFLSWASVMVVEICAYRLLAPEFGNSVFTWTALIGVILIASSAGGYLGGYLADRRLALDMLGWLLAGAAVLVFFIPPLHGHLAPLFSGGRLIAGPVMIALLLFAVPGILLGAVSPAAVRFYSLTSKDTHVGASAGVISMLGSLGSFVGTFLSGFFLLSTFGVRSIFFGVALLLMLLAIAAFTLARNSLKQQLPVLLAGLVAAVLALADRPQPPADVIYEEESFYHRIRVSESGQSPNKRRVLELDSTQEGGMNPDNGALILAYQHFWRLSQLNENLKINRALFLGAGAFGMPNELSRILPDAHVDVAEIDPRVIEVGRHFFQLNDHPRVHAHADDARRFLRLHDRPEQRWDLIFGDAYNGIRAIPVHLTSREFFQLVHDRLTDDGVFIMNVITAVQGPRSELLSGILGSVRSAFPFVEVFGVGGRRDEPQNVILLATKTDWKPRLTERFYPPDSLQQRLVSTYIPAPQLPQATIAFTDNLNPVDAIIARGLMTR
jgi:spermidine synthase